MGVCEALQRLGVVGCERDCQTCQENRSRLKWHLFIFHCFEAFFAFTLPSLNSYISLVIHLFPVLVLEKVINLSHYSLHLKNYFGAKAFHTAIAHPAVSRLSHTFECLRRSLSFSLSLPPSFSFSKAHCLPVHLHDILTLPQRMQGSLHVHTFSVSFG